jgi:hypothetical protein
MASSSTANNQRVNLRVQPQYTLTTIPASKLLFRTKAAELRASLGKALLVQLENRAKEETSKPGKPGKLTAKLLKQYLAEDNRFMNAFRKSPLGQRAYDSYVANVRRLSSPTSRQKAQATRRAMAPARKGFAGCIATRLEPADFEHCALNYDSTEYDHIDLIPEGALRSAVALKTNNLALAPPSSAASINYLPRGIRAYIRHHPEKYRHYMKERKREMKYLKAMRRGMEMGTEDIEAVLQPLASPGTSATDGMDQLDQLERSSPNQRRSKRLRQH